jgi:PBP1b-binding outer membrane lipoprotein LpoB
MKKRTYYIAIIAVILLLTIVIFLAGCSRKTYTEKISDSHDTTAIAKDYISRSYVEKVKETTIDSMLKIKLPVEESHAVTAKTHQISHLETSLAKSNAFIDSSGYLHHDLFNKDSAKVMSKFGNSTQTITKHDTINHTDTLRIGAKTKYFKVTTVQKHKFLENFFYFSGLILYIGIIILIVYECCSKGYLSTFEQFLKKIFKK